jgi:hypothetical protein
MNNFMLHVPGLGVEAMNAIKPVAEIGFILSFTRSELRKPERNYPR